MRSARRCPALLLAMLAMLPLSSCGICLWQVERATTLRQEDGAELTVLVRERQVGLFEMEPDSPVLPALFAGVLFDWIDTLVITPVQGVRATFDADASIEGGVFGFLLALTPVASTSPGMTAAIDAPRVTPAQLATLRGPDSAERRAVIQQLFGARADELRLP